MPSVQAGMWDPQPPFKHASTLPQTPHSSPRLAHVTTATPAKRITFYKSGDNQFGGVRMAVHKRSFKCFDALLDDLSQKIPLPFGVRTVTTPHGIHTIKHLEQLQDGGCYLCSDQRRAKPINMELARKRSNIWHHHSQRPHPPETSPSTPNGHVPYRQRRILLVKNREPGMRRSVVLSRRSARSLKAFLDEVSEVMQFHVRKLYTLEGRRIDSVQSLMTCPGVLVCVGREPFSPALVNFIRMSSDEILPGLGSRSSGLGPRIPGNGARSPAIQAARSSPRGAQSRASEYSEGQESRKNVNFGLETKKSIIHPRSDSSNRSTRFSLSSEKSYSQARPAIMNDDIEKRVVVNKDGSLSVEMRVRFRLQNDETLQWSTQINKSPSLTSECCPLSQGQSNYLQHGQSESCSDHDSTSFDPVGMDYASQQQQHVSEDNHCPCYYQRQEPQYDMWQNPVHRHKHHPVPPPHTSNHIHTRVRHTHSSSSSSSCNSRRVVRCRARLSKSGGGSGSEQSHLVQEEMCVTERVERTVEVEENGDTHVEISRVSRCSEVVAMDSNLQPLSQKSEEDELMMEGKEEHPLSTVSSSSHILQSLKEDQDDDLPPSASQCCHRNELSPTFVSAASACHCGAATPNSVAKGEETHETPRMSRTSCRSSKPKVPASEGAHDDEHDEIKRVVSGLSGHTGILEGSLSSSVCPHCGGCKSGVTTGTNGRTSQKSRDSRRASPKPAARVSNPENANEISGEDKCSNVSSVLTKTNKTNLSNHSCFSTSNGRNSHVVSRVSNPEAKGEERAPSAKSQRSNRSHKFNCNGSTGVRVEKGEERSPSAMSAQSSKSPKSSCHSAAEYSDFRTREEADGAVEKAHSSLSALTGSSSKTNASFKLRVNVASPTDSTTVEKDTKDQGPTSSLFGKNEVSDKPGKVERCDSVSSGKSNKSHVSVMTNTSQRSSCSKCARAISPAEEPVVETVQQEEGIDTEERAASANSKKSYKSNKASERSDSPRSQTEANNRTISQMSGRSVKTNTSVKSSKSCTSNSNGNEAAASLSLAEAEAKCKMTQEKTQQADNAERAASVMSCKSHKSNCNETPGAISETGDNIRDDEDKANTEAMSTEDRTSSAMSGNSHSSTKSSTSQRSHCTAASLNPNSTDGRSVTDKEQSQERASSILSVKSKSSARSSRKSDSCANGLPSSPKVTTETQEGGDEEGDDTTERALSSASAKSGKSQASFALSHTSSHSGGDEVVETADTKNSKSEYSQSQTLSPRRTCSPHIKSPKVPATPPGSPQSPVQQFLPVSSVGETRGPSALSVHSIKSVKSGGSKCGCGVASAKKGKETEDQDMKNEDACEQASSILSSSSRRMRRESEGTEQLLSENSSGSNSFGLPEDTALSVSGKSSISFQVNTEKVKTGTPGVPKSIEESSLKENMERSGSALSQKSNDKESRSTFSHEPQAVDIMTIETPRGSDERGDKSGKQNQSRAPSAVSAKGSKSCSCSTKAQSTRSVKSKKSSNTDAPEKQMSSALSSASVRIKNDTMASEVDLVKNTEKLGPSDPMKCPKKSSSPLPNSRPASKVETCSESTLSQSLSAADLLKETMAAAHPPSQKSKGSKTSDKASNEKYQRSRKQKHQEERELTPACLPNASPIEVVSEWLKSIPADSSMLELSDELHEKDEEEDKVSEKPEEEAANEAEGSEDEKIDEHEKAEAVEEEEEDQVVEGVATHKSSDPASSQPQIPLTSSDSLPRNWQSSAALMKVLLNSPMERCQSLPEVSPVHGRRLSTSALGFLDCLAQLQLIEPAVPRGSDQQKGHQYADIMTILQSLWLIENRDIEAKETKDIGTDQVTPPRSSSGVDMRSGSGGSGKETGNKGVDENQTNVAVPLCKDEQEVNAEAQLKENEAGPWEKEQSTIPANPDSPTANNNPSSLEKSSANDSSKSPTDNEGETLEESSTSTPPTVLQASVSKRKSQDPNPVWILKLLKKLEKQFMNHYVNAMAEFKVRWDLEDSVILDTMISELRTEVSQRIQSSIEREMKKIHGRAGRAEWSAQPPKEPNLSRESTMTEKRRRMLRVMKNQSVKTADSFSDEEMTGDFSDQRSEDDYCPCDACVRKKMAARPLKTNPAAAEAPMMMEFDLLKILQLKKSPAPSIAQPRVEEAAEGVAVEEDLSTLQEEEEEEQKTKEDIKADVILEETIPEEDEEAEDGGEAGEEKVGEGKEALCQCAKYEEEEENNVAEVGEGEEKTSINTGEEEPADNEEVREEETTRGENTNDEGEDVTEECQGKPYPEEGEETISGVEASEETNDDNGVNNATNEESAVVEQIAEGSTLPREEVEDDSSGEESHQNATGGESEWETSEEARAASQGPGVTRVEEANGIASEANEDESGHDRQVDKERGGDKDTGEQEEGGDNEELECVLLHQFTQTSLESQPGSLDDIDSPPRL